MDFEGRVVIVTGAAGNLGIAVAKGFHSAGASLVLVDRKTDRLPRLFPELDPSHHLLATGVDLTDETAVKGMVDRALQRFGHVDVLVNTAGGYRAGTPVHETTLDLWDFMLDMNARTVLVTSRAVVPVMLEQGAGKIVNVASRAAFKSGRNSVAYSASKSAVLRLTESLSAELKRDGIHVNCVVPGTIDTPQNREAMPRADVSRWVAPEALVDVILFLASGSVHGAAIPVYGEG